MAVTIRKSRTNLASLTLTGPATITGNVTITGDLTVTGAGSNIRLDNAQGVEWGGANNFITGNETSDFVDIYTNGIQRMRIASTGAVTLTNLAGTGSRTVVADANGVLSAP